MPPGKTTMQLMPIDSAESLEAADLPPGAARAIVRVITDHVDAAVSNLATKDELERLRLDMTSEFETSRLATTNEIQASRSAMKSDFDEFRVYSHRSFVKWSMALFGALISSYATLVFLVIQHLQK